MLHASLCPRCRLQPFESCAASFGCMAAPIIYACMMHIDDMHYSPRLFELYACLRRDCPGCPICLAHRVATRLLEFPDVPSVSVYLMSLEQLSCLTDFMLAEWPKLIQQDYKTVCKLAKRAGAYPRLHGTCGFNQNVINTRRRLYCHALASSASYSSESNGASLVTLSACVSPALAISLVKCPAACKTLYYRLYLSMCACLIIAIKRTR